MARGYDENSIRQQVRKLLKANPHLFYTDKIVNYRGKTTDQATPYSEVIADELIKNFQILSTMENKVSIRSTKSFKLNHQGKPNVDARLDRFNKLSFSEKLLAIALFNSEKYFDFGKIFDYQVPLKEKQKQKLGEIDLVAIDNSAIKLIELKIKGSNDETLLRALIEIYTYYRLINGSLKKFIKDYKFENRQEFYFQACIVTDQNALSGKTLHNLKDYPCIVKLINTMKIETGIPIELYTYDYPSHDIKYRSKGDSHIDLVGDIIFNKIEM